MGSSCFEEKNKHNKWNYEKYELNSSNSQLKDSSFSTEIYIKDINNLNKIIEKYEE